ncbi:hypothetical protein [Rhodoplanes serenus]|uniref:hypothetical protein n=1 Tax=Rhodoplanes serenus TaxID=200615 RepID=UPI000DACC999|nr:hypothetical protein [Rhodoplanes serenus]RAI34514.1 hypothetical protein CH340_08790 [Rhodoplanes serenus]
MKLTIVRADSIVIVDGVSATVDLSDLSTHISAVQWADGRGWIEFEPDARGVQDANLPIADLGRFQVYVDRHAIVVAEARVAETGRRIEAAERKAAEQKARDEHAAALAAAQAEAERAAAAQAEERVDAAERLAALEAQNAALEARLAALESGNG